MVNFLCDITHLLSEITWNIKQFTDKFNEFLGIDEFVFRRFMITIPTLNQSYGF